MELYQLRSFVAVAEEGNLTRAAERLFTSQPAVSAHIKALEDELGVALFDRTSRGMLTTRDGEALLEKAAATLDSIREINDLARKLQSSPSGPLRIGVCLDGNDLGLETISARISAQFPGIEFVFVHSSTGTIVKGLLNGDLDVGFGEGVIDSPLLEGMKIGVTEVVVVGAPQYKDVFEASDWKGLESLPWVFRTPDCSYHQLMERIARANELTLNRQYIIDHEATCLQFARKGVAISVSNYNTVKNELESGALIAWPGFHGKLDVQLLCLAKRSQERAIQAFFESTRASHPTT